MLAKGPKKPDVSFNQFDCVTANCVSLVSICSVGKKAEVEAKQVAKIGEAGKTLSLTGPLCTYQLKHLCEGCCWLIIPKYESGEGS